MTQHPQKPAPSSVSGWLRSHLGLIVAITTVLSSLVTVATWLGWTPAA
ncbi:hypothetical protein [Nocardiopsis dassonvillei]